MKKFRLRQWQIAYNSYDVAEVFNFATGVHSRQPANAVADGEYKKLWQLIQPLLLGEMSTRYTEILRTPAKDLPYIDAVFHVVFCEREKYTPGGHRTLVGALYVRSVSVSYMKNLSSNLHNKGLPSFYADFFRNIKLKEVLM